MITKPKGLLPCPFCGCKDVFVKTRKTLMVECGGCGAVMFDYQNGVNRDPVGAWNRRSRAAIAAAIGESQ